MSKPFLLYTFPTPNGVKVSAFLEELKTVYPSIQYDVESINISTNIQKRQYQEPWFIKLNPNGRIPVLVDRSRNDFTVFETGAILLYLQQHYDKENNFGWDPKENPDEYSQSLQWMFFANAGVGPMQGQLNHFNKAAPIDIPYAKKRSLVSSASPIQVAELLLGYLDETKRLYGVLEIRLGQDRDWLVGPGRGVYSIADINVLAWVRVHAFGGIESLDEWPNVKKWVEAAHARPGFSAGLDVGRS
ncbi:glutathione S-transferase C-terminal-like protein [Lentinula guzmanii]|uniref:Glutathione S-transferase C-terminal-like protein n=1 Tax=Lentinula guzmanii TaxID=2804957 RepID=A0AA38K0F9_9AGAR|nr:glutathione S-transferase C-terminal-like protein [Lentinula guzmanii]